MISTLVAPLAPMSPRVRGGLLLAVVLCCLATPARAQLFGLSENVALLRLADNGTTFPIGAPIANDLEAQNLAAIDHEARIYWFTGYDQATAKAELVGVSLLNGSVVARVPLPFVEEAFVGVGQLMAWAPDLQRMVMTGQSADATHLVGTVDVRSGAWKQVAAISRADLDVLGGACAYVPATHTFVFNLGVGDAIDNYAVDMTTGAVRNASNTDASNIVSMSYNAADGLIYGLGLHIAGAGWNRSIAVLDPATLAIREIGVVDAWGIESGGISALSAAADSLYWIGMAAPYAPGAPLYLIQNSLRDAAVISAGLLCADDASCPWSLEFAD